MEKLIALVTFASGQLGSEDIERAVDELHSDGLLKYRDDRYFLTDAGEDTVKELVRTLE